MKFKRGIQAVVIFLSSVGLNQLYAQKLYEVADPSGNVKARVEVTDQGVSYSVEQGGELMIGKSPASMTLSDGSVFGKKAKVKKVVRRNVDELIYPPLYRKQTIVNKFNEMTLQFKEGYSLLFRAYADGVAYRFVSDLKEPFKVLSEEVQFNIANPLHVYAAFPRARMNDGKEDPFYSSFQNTYQYMPLSEWIEGGLAFMPLLVEAKGGKKICITEVDFFNYPGMYLTSSADHKGLKGVFPAYPDKVVPEVRNLKGVVKTRHNHIAQVEGKTEFPWRVMIISDKDTQLLDNDMAYKLAKPAQFDDFSWIKPGKVAWDWWNNWSLYGVDFRAGINTATYKHYVDFASKYGIEYVILDEGWAVPGDADLFQVVPEIDMKEIIRYAKSKGVDIILWAGYLAFDNDMERVCKHYSEMGVKGFKLDFIDRDDQCAVEFCHRAAAMGAKYKLLIDIHGIYKPTGLQRTYPNTINFEGVFGLEELKWAKDSTDMVTYDVTMPFIRMIAGPVDYTQGAMKNAIKENFRSVYTEPMSQGTRCRQLAEYVIFESPINMLCDSPANYEREPECTTFIASVPTVWDETLPLQAEVSKHIVTARRKGDVWYVGGLTNWDARDVELDLSFLASGTYEAELFRDGINADLVAQDYKREVLSVAAGQKLNVHLAPGGGFALRLKMIR